MGTLIEGVSASTESKSQIQIQTRSTLSCSLDHLKCKLESSSAAASASTSTGTGTRSSPAQPRPSSIFHWGNPAEPPQHQQQQLQSSAKKMGYVNQLLDAHNVKVLGTGDQWLVLAHGFGCDQTVWQFIVPHFLDKYKILLFDLMGAGSTNPQHFNFARYATLHAYADDLLTILDEMEIESCIYVGHSMSGMIGCIASVERPSVFQKLILLSTAPK